MERIIRVHPEEFEAIMSRKKNYYIILNVLHYCEVGDSIRFIEIEWGRENRPTGREISRTISYIGHDVGVYPKEVILSFKETITGFWMDKPENGNKVQMKNGVPVCSCWCSNCNAWLDLSDEYPVTGRYCPSCGTKMEE